MERDILKKAMAFFAKHEQVRFVFIQGDHTVFSVHFMCSALGVTRSGYYAWQHRPLSARAQQHRQLTRQLRVVHAESRQTYGRPRLHRALPARGMRIGEKHVAAPDASGRPRRRTAVAGSASPPRARILFRWSPIS